MPGHDDVLVEGAGQSVGQLERALSLLRVARWATPLVWAAGVEIVGILLDPYHRVVRQPGLPAEGGQCQGPLGPVLLDEVQHRRLSLVVVDLLGLLGQGGFVILLCHILKLRSSFLGWGSLLFVRLGYASFHRSAGVRQVGVQVEIGQRRGVGIAHQGQVDRCPTRLLGQDGAGAVGALHRVVTQFVTKRVGGLDRSEPLETQPGGRVSRWSVGDCFAGSSDVQLARVLPVGPG